MQEGEQKVIGENEEQYKLFVMKRGWRQKLSPQQINTIQLLSGKSSCEIYSNQWPQKQMPIIVPYILEWDAQFLELYANYEPRMLIQIHDIKFAKLKSINFSTNSIDSIESLCRMWMPELKCLWLWNNVISNMGCLRKCHFEQLQTLDLKNNQIRDHAPLSQIAGLKLNRLDIDFGRSIANASWMSFAKIDAINLKSFCLHQSSEIFRNSKKVIILKKYAKITSV